MTYAIERRADGAVDIVRLRPTLVGTFPDMELARRVLRLLEADEAKRSEVLSEVSAEAAPVAVPTVPEGPVEPPVTPQVAGDVPAVARPSTGTARAIVPDRPRAPARVVAPAPVALKEEQLDDACARLSGGEKLAIVARDFGVNVNVLRGHWGHYRRMLQRHMAQGGSETCRLCATPFMPSISHPDTCARCSHA